MRVPPVDPLRDGAPVWNVFHVGPDPVKVAVGLDVEQAIRHARALGSNFAPGLATPSWALALQEVRERRRWAAEGRPADAAGNAVTLSPSPLKGELSEDGAAGAERTTRAAGRCPDLAAFWGES